MSRDLVEEDYYISNGGKIPVKWTAPEVSDIYQIAEIFAHVIIIIVCICLVFINRLFTIRSIPVPVMCGASESSCLSCGALGASPSTSTPMQRYAYHVLLSPLTKFLKITQEMSALMTWSMNQAL